MRYPVPAVCKSTLNPVLQTGAEGVQIFIVVILRFPACLHLGRCSAFGECEWRVHTIKDAARKWIIILLCASNGRQNCEAA